MRNTGIVFWNLGLHDVKADADIVLTHSSVVPGTGHRRNDHKSRLGSGPVSEIGEVTHHIVLEGYIVFTTDKDKLFAFSTASTAEESFQSSPVELTTFFSSQSTSSVHIQDLQGSFRSFGVFKSSGEVLIGSTSFIDTFIAVSKSQHPTSTLPKPARIASLQCQSVATLAFGDYHIHALHSNGTISSFGVDPERVGAFGLGHHGLAAGLRGAQNSGTTRDQVLDGKHRRTIWFEPLMLYWLSYCFATILQSRLMIDLSPDWVFKSGEWFEQQGSRWEEGIHDGEDELPAYFALKVSAAGWHSAALVLVDEEKAEKARRKHIKQPLAEEKASGTTSNNLVLVRQAQQGNLVIWLADSVARIWNWSLWLVRWFLGLTARDAAATVADIGLYSNSREGGKGNVRYVWEDQELPHLSWLPS